jgi:hypothetical protein
VRGRGNPPEPGAAVRGVCAAMAAASAWVITLCNTHMRAQGRMSSEQMTEPMD